MMREIVLDTETTGLDARKGDRLIELGCIELLNRVPTGREYHTFLNPETRDVHPDAERVHGISTGMLTDKPFFRDSVDAFLAFIADSPLVIHNANFDIGFLNMELELLGRPALAMDRVVDTLALARRKHPAGPNTLDALCKRYGIDNSKRTKHGALMDSELLAKVYIELLGERQATLGLARSKGSDAPAATMRAGTRAHAVQRPEPLPPRIGAADVQAHAAFVETLGPNAVWKRYS
jgi:DNA polymerase-3 subunit epsilon